MPHTESEQQTVQLNVAILADLRKELRIASAMREMSMSEIVHRALCEHLDRLDLIHQAPVSR